MALFNAMGDYLSPTWWINQVLAAAVHYFDYAGKALHSHADVFRVLHESTWRSPETCGCARRHWPTSSKRSWTRRSWPDSLWLTSPDEVALREITPLPIPVVDYDHPGAAPEPARPRRKGER